MNSKKLLKELSVLDHTTFIYKDELYNANLESIGYLPDLIKAVAEYSDMYETQEEELSDFIHNDLLINIMGKQGKTYKEYAAAIKNELLDYTDLI